MAEPIAVKVKLESLNDMTIDDLVMIEDMREGSTKMTVRTMRDFLNRMIEGGVGSIKLSELPQVMDAFVKALDELANPTPPGVNPPG